MRVVDTKGAHSEFNYAPLFYKIYWGDETTDWLGPYTSGQDVIFNHTWTKPWMPFFLIVSAKDVNNNRCKEDGNDDFGIR